jgi:transcriptional regulator with XRE-family HTH domain
MPDFSDKLKGFIAARNLTANAFAKLSGVPQTTLSGYLRRENRPSWEHVQRIARTLGVTCIDLQDDAEPTPAPPKPKPPAKGKKKGNP